MRATLFICFLLTATLSWAKQIPIDTQASQMQWFGQKKVPGSDHRGTVQLKRGMVNIDKNNQIMGGSLIIDMTSIKNEDLSGRWKTKLENHLNSEDFFHTKKYPKAIFKITKVNTSRSQLVQVIGNLTLRGVTHTESFELKIEKRRENGKSFLVATGEIEIDRNKYGVTYNSETSLINKAIKVAKDKVIKDNIKLTLNLRTETL
jgi:polyisoprenoid-binding protein YceI